MQSDLTATITVRPLGTGAAVVRVDGPLGITKIVTDLRGAEA